MKESEKISINNVNEVEVSIDDIQKIENAIYTIRGQQVLVDRDLAMLYQVETKVLNQA